MEIFICIFLIVYCSVASYIFAVNEEISPVRDRLFVAVTWMPMLVILGVFLLWEYMCEKFEE